MALMGAIVTSLGDHAIPAIAVHQGVANRLGRALPIIAVNQVIALLVDEGFVVIESEMLPRRYRLSKMGRDVLDALNAGGR